MTLVRRAVATATLATLALATAITPALADSSDSAPSRLDALLAQLGSSQVPAELDAGYTTDTEFAEIVTDQVVIPAFDCAGATQDIVIIGHTSPARQLIAVLIAPPIRGPVAAPIPPMPLITPNACALDFMSLKSRVVRM